MNGPNPFRRTFLRSYWHLERLRMRKPYPGLLIRGTGTVTGEEYLEKLSLTLGVREKGRAGAPHTLDELIDSGERRIALFDLIGAGKRTVARRSFHARMSGRVGQRRYLPCWLPDPEADKDTRAADLITQIATAASDSSLRLGSSASSPPSLDKDLIDTWLRLGPPLLLFLELDQFSDPNQALEQVQSLLSPKYGDTCCIIMCHSNMGWNRHPELLSGKGFKAFEIAQPAAADLVKQYQHHLRSARLPANSGVPHERLQAGRILPQVLHLLCHYVEAVNCRTEALVFEKAEEALLARDYDAFRDYLTRISYFDYPKVMKIILGTLSYQTLGFEPSFRDPVGEDDLSGFEPATLERFRPIFREALRRHLPGRFSRGQWEVEVDEVIELVVNHTSFLMLRPGNEIRFVHDFFLPYFSARYLLLRRGAATGDDRSWLDELVTELASHDRFSDRVAEFVGGLLGRGELPELLLAVLRRLAGFGKPDPAKQTITGLMHLHRSLLNLCRGTDSNCRVAQALLRGHKDHEWYALGDPLLLPGQIHGVVVDQAHQARSGTPGKQVLEDFAKDLAGGLDDDGSPWLERTWPIPIDVGQTTEHDGRVTALLLLTDGRIVSGDALGCVIVWDWKTGARVVEELHSGAVRALAELVQENRLWIVSAGDDRNVRLWCPDQKDQVPRTQPRRHAGKVLALAAVSRGGIARVLSAGEDGLLYLWSLGGSGDSLSFEQGHRGPVRFLCALGHVDPLLVASAGDDGSIQIWKIDRDRPERLRTIPPPKRPHPITALAGNSAYVVWGDELGRVFSIQPDTPSTTPHRFSGQGQAVTDISLERDGFITFSQDGPGHRWGWHDHRRSRASGQPVAFPPGLPLPNVDPPQPARFVTRAERIVRIGRNESKADPGTMHRSRVSSVAVGTDYFVSGGNDGCVMLFVRDSGLGEFVPRRRWPMHHSGPVPFLKVSDRLIITAGKDGRVCVWEVDLPKVELREVWRGARVTALWAEDQTVIWGGADGRIFRGNPELRKVDLLSKGDGSEVTALDARRSAGDGPVADVIAATSNGKVYRLGGAAPSLREPLTIGSEIIALCWLAPDRHEEGRIAVATKAGGAILDLNDPNSTRTTVEAAGPSVLATSADGRWAVFGTSSGRISMQDTTSGETHALEMLPSDKTAARRDRRTESSHSRSKVVALQFATDQVLVWASRDGKVHAAGLDTGRPQLMAGYPIGGQITAMDVKSPNVLVGLADGSHVALVLHWPAAIPKPNS